MHENIVVHAYEAAQRMMAATTSTTTAPAFGYKAVLAHMMVGAAEALVVSPLEVLKTRQQLAGRSVLSC